MKDEALRLALKALENPWKAGPNGVADAITAIKQALANDALDKVAENERELGIQMEPKPVGQLWEYAYGRGQVVWFSKPADESMLYTSPPKREWQDLTETEWREIDERHDWRTTQGRIDAAEEIETKLKEKNT